MTKGGKRPGAGRPPAPPSVIMRLRLPLPLHAQVMERGGVVWVKRVVSEAIERKL